MMRAVRSRGCEVSPAPSSASAVHIMSIHKSKGLEFPIVILANCAQRFNTNDLTNPVLIHPELGVGFRRRQIDRRIEYPTLPRLAIAVKARQEMLSEEERILYVAMTRAKEKTDRYGARQKSGRPCGEILPDIQRAPPAAPDAAVEHFHAAVGTRADPAASLCRAVFLRGRDRGKF